MPKKSFTTHDYNDFDMKTAEWRGYTLKALEDMNNEIKANTTKLEEIDKKLTNQMIKIGIIGGIMGLIGGTVISILLHSLLGG